MALNPLGSNTAFDYGFGGKYRIDRDGNPLNIPQRENTKIELVDDKLSKSGFDRFSNINGGEKLVNGLIGFEKLPVEAAQRHQFRIEDQISAYGYVKSAVYQFQDSIQKLQFASNYTSLESKVQNPEIAQVSTNSAAKAGRYKLQVHQIAQSSTIASAGFIGNSTAIAQAGDKLKINVAGKETTIDFSQAAGLSEIAEKINSSDAKVSASIIFDGSKYRMIVKSNETGANSTVTIQGIRGENNKNSDLISQIEKLSFDGNFKTDSIKDEDIFKKGTSFFLNVAGEEHRIVLDKDVSGADQLKEELDKKIQALNLQVEISTEDDGDGKKLVFDAAGKSFRISANTAISQRNEKQAQSLVSKFNSKPFYSQVAQDASFTLDGIQLRSATNKLTNSIPGISIEILNTGRTDINVVRDETKAVELIQNFTDAYNRMINAFDILSTSDPGRKDESKDPVLSGDTTLFVIRRTMGSFLSMVNKGIKKGFNNLASFGLSTNPRNRGLMEFNALSLSQKIKDNPGALQDLLSGAGEFKTFITQADGSKIVQSSSMSIAGSSIKTKSGTYEVVVTAAPWAVSAKNKVQNFNKEAFNFEGEDASFEISVNGGAKVKIDLGTLKEEFQNIKGEKGKDQASLSRVAFILQESLNKQEQISSAGGVQVVYNLDNQSFDILSNRQNAKSSIKLENVSQKVTDLLGFVNQESADKIAGTINGLPALGDGLVLKGQVGSPAEGMEISVSGGLLNTRNVTEFSAGLSYQWDATIENMINDVDGVLKSKVNSLERQLKTAERNTERALDLAKQRADALRRTFMRLNGTLAGLQAQKESVVQMMRNNGWLKVEK